MIDYSLEQSRGSVYFDIFRIIGPAARPWRLTRFFPAFDLKSGMHDTLSEYTRSSANPDERDKCLIRKIFCKKNKKFFCKSLIRIMSRGSPLTFLSTGKYRRKINMRH